MSSSVRLTIAQPCSESWDAMTPTATGRHCAACAKTVVDFSLKTDAEILAYLAQAAGSTCGRFRSGQLERPLCPPEPLAPARRWRTWLAAAVAVWAVREGSGSGANAQMPRALQVQHPTKKPAPPTHVGSAPVIRGVVRDPATHEPLPGVAVFLKGENRRTTTDSMGRFRLRVPGQGARPRHSLVLHLFGYQSRTVPVPSKTAQAETIIIELHADEAASGAQVTGYMPVRQMMMTGGAISMVVGEDIKPPAKVRLRPHRTFFEWLTQPFRRG